MVRTVKILLQFKEWIISSDTNVKFFAFWGWVWFRTIVDGAVRFVAFAMSEGASGATAVLLLFCAKTQFGQNKDTITNRKIIDDFFFMSLNLNNLINRKAI